jgi:hypothetical protein
MRRAFFFAIPVLIAMPLAAQESSFGLKPESFAGDWTISDTNPTGGCRITLEVMRSPFGYPAYVFGCTADDILHVTGWRLRNTSILLTDDKGVPVVLLKIKDRNRFQGRGPSGRSIVLSR